MFLMGLLTYCFLFWLLEDLSFMEAFARWLGKALIFLIPDPEFGALVGKIAYAIFYPSFHYWASFVLAVYITYKQTTRVYY